MIRPCLKKKKPVTGGGGVMSGTVVHQVEPNQVIRWPDIALYCLVKPPTVELLGLVGHGNFILVVDNFPL